MPKLQIEVDDGALEDMLRLQKRLESPNLATALYNAVTIVLAHYGYYCPTQQQQHGQGLVRGGAGGPQARMEANYATGDDAPIATPPAARGSGEGGEGTGCGSGAG